MKTRLDVLVLTKLLCRCKSLDGGKRDTPKNDTKVNKDVCSILSLIYYASVNGSVLPENVPKKENEQVSAWAETMPPAFHRACGNSYLGSGATETFNTFGLFVRGVQAAHVTDARSRNVTNPVGDIVEPDTLSFTTSIRNRDVSDSQNCARSKKRMHLIKASIADTHRLGG